MQHHVFNKKPSRSDIENAMQYSDPREQMEALAQSMTPAKGELWQHGSSVGYPKQSNADSGCFSVHLLC